MDEFPHTNVPGSQAGLKRWEDVQVLLDAGIDVLTTMNVQHLESLNDQIWQSTGVRVRETIPDWVLKQADEIVMVDLTPRALLNRLERGVIYPIERARAALQNFFKESTLVALRELAMRQTAHAVETRQPGDEPDGATGAASGAAARAPAAADRAAARQRGADPSGTPGGRLPAGRVLRRVRVEDADLSELSAEERETIERQLNFARALQIETRILQGDDVADTLVNFARTNGVTQIFVMRQKNSRMPLRCSGEGSSSALSASRPTCR